MKTNSEPCLRLFVFVLVALINHSVFVLAQERPLYLDENQPIGSRVDDLLSRLTLEEKVSLVHADSNFSTAGVPRLGVPKLIMDDGPLGVREDVGEGFRVLNRVDDFATAMPGTLGLAATWDPDLAVEFGAVIGQEAKQRGKDIMLGPAINIQRTPSCGRNYEYMGEDPFLTSRIAVGYIKGEQAQGVASCVKHFAANSQEYERMSINEIIDERTLREIYLPGFRAAVREAGVMAVMGAYNQINGEHCCENEHLLNEILKGEWGFKGVAMSDWSGVHHTSLAALNGMDMEMGTRPPYESNYLAAPFLEGLRSGEFPISVLDDKVRRHLYVMFRLNLIHDPAVTNAVPAARSPLSTPEHQETARKVAEESFVLLKNKSLLPLRASKIKTIAVIGGNAAAKFTHEGGSAMIKAPFEITALDGISNYIGDRAKIIYAEGYYPPENEGKPGLKPDGSTATPEDSSRLVDEAVATARSADIVIYVGGLNRRLGFDSEGADRWNLKLPAGQDELLKRIVGANPKTVVVLIGGGAVEMYEGWLSRAPALLYAWYPGMEGGSALARVLFGDVNPSGKLPCTFPRKLTDTPAAALGAYPGTNGSVLYKEGLLVGYRWYDTKKIEPLFPFGFGLSYTQFKYSKLNLLPPGDSNVVTVNFEIKNTGTRAGAEVAQIYVQPLHPSVFRPLKELKGFRKIFLQPGETRKITIALDSSAFAYYDVGKKGWVAEKGEYKILVGSSSRDVRLTGAFDLKSTVDAGHAGWVRLTENALAPSAGDLDCYKIETENATYFLEKTGGGLCSLVDKDGRDWLGFSPQHGSGAGGEFRGFPNAVFHQSGGSYFHARNAGTDLSTAKVDYAGSDHVTISVESSNRLWAAEYDFFPMHCIFTMTRMPADRKYWVLYEGVPGGQFDDADWWMTSDVKTPQAMSVRHDGDIPSLEWICFGVPKLNRSLFLLHQEDDNFPDTFYQMEHKMTVFGFGRSNVTSFIDRVPQHFSIGFLETTNRMEIERSMERLAEP